MLGNCYTFNSGTAAPFNVTQAGLPYGIRLNSYCMYTRLMEAYFQDYELYCLRRSLIMCALRSTLVSKLPFMKTAYLRFLILKVIICHLELLRISIYAK